MAFVLNTDKPLWTVPAFRIDWKGQCTSLGDLEEEVEENSFGLPGDMFECLCAILARMGCSDDEEFRAHVAVQDGNKTAIHIGLECFNLNKAYRPNAERLLNQIATCFA